nr:hypothetical protein [Tanacetum cinerariifolium]
MSDSDESRVTYTDISSPFEELSHIGSPRADDHEYLMMLEDPYVEDQPYAEDASPIAQRPEYVPESDFEMYLEDDDDEDPEVDPVDYPADGGDDGDDEEDSSEDEEDDEMDVEADEEEEEEEEHPAPADYVIVALTVADQAPSAEETEPFETDESAATPPPHPAYRTTARISIPAPIPMPAWTDLEVVRLLAISSPPASPLSPCPIRSLGYRAAMIRLRDEAASTSHSPPSQLPSASRMEDRPEVTLPPRKRRQTVISELLRIDHRRSTETSKLRIALQGQITALQGQVTALQAQVTTLQGQQRLAGDPTHPEPPEEAGGSA